MSEPYLIAHKVRGEAAFDIAERLTCPECARGVKDIDGELVDCSECEGEGYWWIIPTSGHRARPFASWPMTRLCVLQDGPEIYPFDELKRFDLAFITAQPDHYAINDRPAKPTPESEAKGKSLLAQLGLAKPKPTIIRRF